MTTHLRLRPPAVAGMFYPADPTELADMIDRLVHGIGPQPPDEPIPHALVVPHAGYLYSGPIAASAYARVAPTRSQVRRVVLLGPAHRVAVRSMALSSADAWSTPLGLVPVDAEGRDVALSMHGVDIDDSAHALEHSLEVQVPFLQRVLGDGWCLVPVVVGTANADDVAGLLDRLWGGPETLVVVSTDLSHYHDQPTAQRLDAATAASIVARDPAAIEPDRACGAFPLRGLLELARRRGLGVQQLDLRTSGDTSGDRSRVVGYGAFALR